MTYYLLYPIIIIIKSVPCVLESNYLFHLKGLGNDRLKKKMTAKVHPKCVKCWGVKNASTSIAFLFAKLNKGCLWPLKYNFLFPLLPSPSPLPSLYPTLQDTLQVFLINKLRSLITYKAVIIWLASLLYTASLVSTHRKFSPGT